ncbi:hypothetical protein BS78_01G155800 [Paspalum vaginatum]|nr:hypothetical protein BS78_01G155800 [Paspalum vaginatum]
MTGAVPHPIPRSLTLHSPLSRAHTDTVTAAGQPSGAGQQSKRMAKPKPPLQAAAILLVLLLVAAASWVQTAAAAPGFCSGKCSVRCGRASPARARGACMRSCGLCCEECNCVPTGPVRGGASECPCYHDMLTAGPRKRPKCP